MQIAVINDQYVVVETAKPSDAFDVDVVLALLRRLLEIFQKDKIFTFKHGFGGHPAALSGASFWLVWPVFREILINCQTHRSPSDDDTFGALDIVQIHTRGDEDYPRDSMVRVLRYVMEVAERLREQAATVVIELSRSASPEVCLEFVHGLLNSELSVRTTCLASLKISVLENHVALDRTPFVLSRLWLSRYDKERENSTAADALWQLLNPGGAPPSLELCTSVLVSFVSHTALYVRTTAADALGGAFHHYRSALPALLTQLTQLYTKCMPHVEEKKYGPPGDPIDDAHTSRHGVALAFKGLGHLYGQDEILFMFSFLIQPTPAMSPIPALSDDNSAVRQQMLQSGIDVIQSYGQPYIGSLLPMFEAYLDGPAGATVAADRVRGGVIVFLGSLAAHLPQNDGRIPAIVDRMLESLKLASELVHRAVSVHIAPLAPAVRARVPTIVRGLITRLSTCPTYWERRGAAYGLAGIIKGVGLPLLNKSASIHDNPNIVVTLKKFLEGELPAGTIVKTSAERSEAQSNVKQGALFAVECVCEQLGRLFEPYMALDLMDPLLGCFSDKSFDVLEAAKDAAKAFMTNLTAPGVNMVLPKVLKGLQDRNWRTKRESVELLGSMAFCAPAQLSKALPTIMPHILDVLGDSHPSVQAAGHHALASIASVIKSPEIVALVPVLLSALQNPTDNTQAALDALATTAWSHRIDAPSMALIIPIIHRGLRHRSNDAKKRAAKVIGHICALLQSPADLVPYLDLVLPFLKTIVVDPIPEVRAAAGTALGNLVKGVGEQHFTSLIQWLLDTIKSDLSAVERSGAAQGLSEVVAGLPPTRLSAWLPEILENTAHSRAYVREGAVSCLIFLPLTLKQGLVPWIQAILSCVLRTLADEAEFVREAAMRAGRVIVAMYSKSNLPLLLASLKDGLFHESWRIRQSSIQLLSDFLFRITGVCVTEQMTAVPGTAQVDLTAAYNSASEQSKALQGALGTTERRMILAALCMVRSDPNQVVRQTCHQVWKSMVDNTPRTLREILPVMMDLVLSFLASDSNEKRQVAGRSLGELVRKLGDRVLPEVLPILQQGLKASDGDTRQGVCVGLCEVLTAAGKQYTHQFLSSIAPLILKAICDPLPAVRQAGAQAFDTLCSIVGSGCVQDLLPTLIENLDDESSVLGLEQMVALRARAILPVLIPHIAEPPISGTHAKALAAIANVAGAEFVRFIDSLVPTLVFEVARAAGTDDEEPLKDASTRVILSIPADGLYDLFTELFKLLLERDPKVRLESVRLISNFVTKTKHDFSQHTSSLLGRLISTANDSNQEVMVAGWETTKAITAAMPKEALPQYIHCIREALRALSDSTTRNYVNPAFALPKGLDCVLPYFLQGLMNGTAEIREAAASGLGEIVEITPEATLAPFVIPITGPLIRVIGDRFPSQVKAAILASLTILLERGAKSIRAFVPQLQTTFIRSMQDPTRAVRTQALLALRRLIPLASRVDSLVNELSNTMKAAEKAVRETIVKALQIVVELAAAQITAPARDTLSAAVGPLVNSDEESMRDAARAIMDTLLADKQS
eukprot:gnl/Spiro4/1676_TR880_c0_g1_i1.p1 gnl/Spiro4/1676_TR880_c0_g1~~gnl/Spiro4/1676_TR880_c0_g1_i1.p1  ORF type:complete len:1552 (-),score=416.40 gnl/Spiro4/1676_TR880_c0_g1_i1:3-4658(-)